MEVQIKSTVYVFNKTTPTNYLVEVYVLETYRVFGDPVIVRKYLRSFTISVDDIPSWYASQSLAYTTA